MYHVMLSVYMNKIYICPVYIYIYSPFQVALQRGLIGNTLQTAFTTMTSLALVPFMRLVVEG